MRRRRIARWQQMRGRSGEIFTGHALFDLCQNKTLVRHQVTQVYFANLSDRQIEAYVATGEPLQCAGCFALDGKGGLLVDKIVGCHSNVIGLSLPLLRQMLETLGAIQRFLVSLLALDDHWRSGSYLREQFSNVFVVHPDTAMGRCSPN